MIPSALRSSTVALALLALWLVPSQVRAQEWNDGSPSRLQHQCWQGIFPSITEDLAWTYVGFKAPTRGGGDTYGLPRVGEVYYMRIMVAGLGCSGAWARPEVRLPPNTAFAIDGSHPIRCSIGAFDNPLPLTDGNCPTEASLTTTIGGGFVAFPPKLQPYWPIVPGKVVVIEFPVVSSQVLSGIASSNDFLLGAVQFLDQSPGNPVPSYSAPQAGYSTGIPTGSAWQGIFVSAAIPSSSDPTNTWVVFPEPSATGIGLRNDPGNATQSVHVDLKAHAYFPDCFCDSNKEFVADAAPGTPCTNSASPLQCCVYGGNTKRSLIATIVPTDSSVPDTVVYVSGSCGTQVNKQQDCTFTFRGLQYGVSYDYGYAPPAGAIYNAAPGCAATGTPPVATAGTRNVLPIDPAVLLKRNLLVRVEGSGTVARDPDGSTYDSGTVVTLTATPGTGATFQKWQINGSDVTTNPHAVTMNADVEVAAVFTSPATDGGDSDGGTSTGPSTPAQGCSCGAIDVGLWPLAAGLWLVLRRLRKPDMA